MHDHSCRLVEREQELVLVQNVERKIFRRHRSTSAGFWKRHRDEIAERGACGDPANQPPVHGDVPTLDPRLHARPRRLGNVGQVAPQDEIQPAARVAAIGDDDARGHRISHARR